MSSCIQDNHHNGIVIRGCTRGVVGAKAAGNLGVVVLEHLHYSTGRTGPVDNRRVVQGITQNEATLER